MKHSLPPAMVLLRCNYCCCADTLPHVPVTHSAEDHFCFFSGVTRMFGLSETCVEVITTQTLPISPNYSVELGFPKAYLSIPAWALQSLLFENDQFIVGPPVNTSACGADKYLWNLMPRPAQSLIICPCISNFFAFQFQGLYCDAESPVEAGWQIKPLSFAQLALGTSEGFGKLASGRMAAS